MLEVNAQRDAWRGVLGSEVESVAVDANDGGARRLAAMEEAAALTQITRMLDTDARHEIVLVVRKLVAGRREGRGAYPMDVGKTGYETDLRRFNAVEIEVSERE